MKNQRTTEIKVGLVTLASLALFIVGIILGRGITVRANQPTVKILFPTSGGIDVASPVSVNGVKRGSVTAVEARDGAVFITATLDNIGDLTKNATAKILMLEITGGKKIEITPVAGGGALSDGDVLKGSTAVDISDLIALVGDVSSEAKSIIKRLDTVMTSATQLLADGQVVADARASLHRLNSIAETADELLKQNRANLQATLDDARAITADLRKIVHTSGPKADSLLTNLDKLVARGDRFIASTDKTMRGADSLLAQLSELARDVKTRKGSMAHKLLYDETVGVRLDSLLISLRRVLDIDGVNVNLRLGTRP